MTSLLCRCDGRHARVGFVVPITTPLGLAAMTTALMVAVAAWETLAGRSETKA